MKRFLKKFFMHPGTWVLFTLLFVGMGILFPLSAPALLITAAVTIGLAAIFTAVHLVNRFKDTFVPKIEALFSESMENITLPMKLIGSAVVLAEWAKAHQVQAVIVGLGIGLFITTLVLTIGFFTGGAAFAFMAPVFATIAAPFAATAASAGVQLSLAALAGTTLVLASLNITNIFHRLATWIDSFKYDTFAAKDNDEDEQNRSDDWKADRKTAVETIGTNAGPSYREAIFSGMKATVLNGFSSPDDEKLDPPAPKDPGTEYHRL